MLRLASALLMPIAIAASGIWPPAGLADTPTVPSQPSPAPNQQERLETLKAKGPQASLTLLPLVISGRPFEQATEGLGILLEQRGLQTIELGTTPFAGAVKAELPVLSAALAAFLKTNPVTTDYALYAEFNGHALDEVRAAVVDKAGELVWSDHQTSQDKAFLALGTPRDPMMLIQFLIERLSPQFRLAAAAAKNRKYTRENAYRAKRGLPSQEETDVRMPARLKLMQAARQSATLLVLGVRFDGKAQAASAADLAKRIQEAGVWKTVVPARQPVLLQIPPPHGTDQMQYLWSLAREFQTQAKNHAGEADYVLYADYVFDRQNWEHGGLHCVVCNRQGEWVIADLANSDHEDYRRIKPISAEGCDTLLVERLQSQLR